MTLKYKPGRNWQKGKPISEQDLHPHRTYYQKLLEKGKIMLGGFEQKMPSIEQWFKNKRK